MQCAGMAENPSQRTGMALTPKKRLVYVAFDDLLLFSIVTSRPTI